MSLSETPGFSVAAFGDEAATDLEDQLDVLESVGIDRIDVRGVGGDNVLDLSNDELDAVRETIEGRGFEIPLVGSPIGKVDVTDEFEPHLERFERALEVTDRLGADYLRVFSYYYPEEEDPFDYREEVMRRMRAKVELAAEADTVLCHENVNGIYGETPERARDIFTTVDSPYLRHIFDPQNYVARGREVYPDALFHLVEFVECVHVGGESREDGKVVVGEGDTQIADVLRVLDARGFDGYLSLEPHLWEDGPADTTAENFRLTADALAEILESVAGE